MLVRLLGVRQTIRVSPITEESTMSAARTVAEKRVSWMNEGIRKYTKFRIITFVHNVVADVSITTCTHGPKDPVPQRLHELIEIAQAPGVGRNAAGTTVP